MRRCGIRQNGGGNQSDIQNRYRGQTSGGACAHHHTCSAAFQYHIGKAQSFQIEDSAYVQICAARSNKAKFGENKKREINIIVGTHRLLSKDVIFADLGLLVLDEEQRFGVEHKEKSKL